MPLLPPRQIRSLFRLFLSRDLQNVLRFVVRRLSLLSRLGRRFSGIVRSVCRRFLSCFGSCRRLLRRWGGFSFRWGVRYRFRCSFAAAALRSLVADLLDDDGQIPRDRVYHGYQTLSLGVDDEEKLGDQF